MSSWDDAEKSCNMALECNPTDLHAQLNLAHSYLAKGEYDKGWKEWGKSLGGKFRKEWVYGNEVRWDGTPDKTLVIYGEQGLGDEIFYGSYARVAVADDSATPVHAHFASSKTEKPSYANPYIESYFLK